MRLSVRLTPKASHNKIVGWTLDENGQRILCIKVTAVPEEGKANEALRKILSRALGISKSRISLKRGSKSRLKEIEIEQEEKEVEKLLSAYLSFF